VRRLFVGFFQAINELLLNPTHVLWLCGLLVVVNLVADGSLFGLWSLYHDRDRLQTNLETLKTRSAELRSKLQKAKDPVFLEKEARDRFDLVSQGDLVFVFTDEQDNDDKQ
jgi:cell division protein FtsB